VVTKKIFLKNADEAMHLLGQQDENLRKLEKAYGVQIFLRQANQDGNFSLVIRGAGGKVDKAYAELENIRSRDGGVYQPDISPRPGAQAAHDDSVYLTFQGKHIRPRSEHQKKYVEYANTHDMVFAIGPAGTGKTFLAVACALRSLQLGQVNRIIITRPVIEAGEKLGFLPGDLYEKINPYLKPLYDAFYLMLGTERFHFLRDEETIEIVPLAYMRGRTLSDAFIILDEAQNTTVEQIKMFLTRTGSDSRVIVTGDTTQIDLENKKQSGLVVAEKILADIEGIKFINFSEEDVVRHPLVRKIIRAFESSKG
jgi:phosphate starvation-inducible protein PhoH and related proteins